MLDYVPFDVLTVKDDANLVGMTIVALYGLPLPASPHGSWASSYAQRAECWLLNEHLHNSRDMRLWHCALVLRAYHEEAVADCDAKHSHVTNKGPFSSLDLTVLGGIHQCIQSCIQVWLSCSIPPETYVPHKLLTCHMHLICFLTGHSLLDIASPLFDHMALDSHVL